MFIYLISTFMLSALLLYRWRSTAASKPRERPPPSPRKLPMIGNLHQLGEFPHRSLQSFSKRYGPLMLLHLGNVPVLVVSSADAAREVMKNQDLSFASRPLLSGPDSLTYGSRDVAFAPYGDYWRQMRNIYVLHLLSNKRVQSYGRVREEETSLMIEKLSAAASSAVAVNLSDVFISLTNNVVCRVALGRKYGEVGKGVSLRMFLDEYEELLGISPIGDYVPWLAWTNRFNGLDSRRERVAKQFDEFLEHVFEEHREMSENVGDEAMMDFVDVLLQFQRENRHSSPVEDEAIKAMIVDVFAAGTDTTAASLEWTLAELIRNPAAMKRLQNEVREAAGSKGKIDEQDLEKMPYLKAVLKESLRLHPPVPLLLPRESIQHTKVMGYDIPAATRVLISAWAIGRDPSLWENVQEFHPERFLDTSIDFRGFHFELIPFGSGRRGCPGIGFATSLVQLALANLVHKFEFRLPDGGAREDLDMTELSGLTIHRKCPLLMLISPHV